MLPCICPGDMLTVVPKKMTDILQGDIVVFRRGNALFSHRTVFTGSENGIPYIVTRADNTETEDDGKIFEENVIGVVSRIQRKGRDVPQTKRSGSFTGRFLRFLLAVKYRLQARWRFYLASIFSLFRRFEACRFFLSFGRPADYSLRVDIQFPVESSRFMRKMSPEDFTRYYPSVEKSLKKLKIVAYAENTQIGRISLVHQNHSGLFSGWWIVGTDLKLRYQGTDVERRFWMHVKRLFDKLLKTPLYISLDTRDLFRRLYFRQLGFLPFSDYWDFSSFKPVKRHVYVKKYDRQR